MSRDIQNPWGAHFGTEHNGEAVPEIPFSAKIVRRARDHVDRKLGEAIEIAETVPPLNTDSGWQLATTTYDQEKIVKIAHACAELHLQA